ncbi:MAG: hypothetical protein ACKO2G_10540 [Verrucomicrobiales bacterium]
MTPLLALLVFLIPLGSVFVFDGGIVDPEGAVFLGQYWQDLPIGKMIFNPDRNDWGCYFGRELSHIFDWLDSLCILLLLNKSQFILGIHISAWLANLLVMAMVVWRGPALFPGTNRVFWILLAGIYLSSLPVALSPLVFHRASRLLSATVGLAALWMLIDCRISADRSPRQGKAGGQLHHAAMAAVAATSVLMDRPALAAILAALGVMVLIAIWRKRGWLSAAWLLVAIAVCQIYFSFLGPALNAHYSGFRGAITAQPYETEGLELWKLIVATSRYVANVVPLVMGGLAWWAALLAGGIFAAVVWRQSSGPGKPARFALFAIGVLASLAVAFAITLVTIYVLPDMRFIPSSNCYYYPVYIASLLWLCLAVGSAAAFASAGENLKRALPWCLALMLASNILHGFMWEGRLQQCRWFSAMTNDTQRVRQSCEEKKMHPELSGRHRRLFSVISEECPWLSKTYWPAVEPLTGFFVAKVAENGTPGFWISPGAKLRVHTSAKGTYEVKLTVAGVMDREGRLTIKSKDKVVGEFDLPKQPGEVAEFLLPLELKKGSSTLEVELPDYGPRLKTLGIGELSDSMDVPIGGKLLAMPSIRKAGD